MTTGNSTPRSDEVQRNDEPSKIFALANVPLVIGVIAAYAFFLASLYVTSLGQAFHFPIANLLTSVDYIQFIPQTLAIRNGNYALLLILSTPFLFIIPARHAFKLGFARGFARGRARARERDVTMEKSMIVHPLKSGLMSTANPTKPRLPRWLFQFISRVKARWSSGITGGDAWALSKTVFWVWLMLLLWSIAWDTYWNAGKLAKEYLEKNGRIYTIYLKGAQPQTEGKLFLQSSMYLFAIRDQDNSILAIPQAQVSLITAPLQPPTLATPVPGNASPTTTATPPPASPPSTSPASSVSPTTAATGSPTPSTPK